MALLAAVPTHPPIAQNNLKENLSLDFALTNLLYYSGYGKTVTIYHLYPCLIRGSCCSDGASAGGSGRRFAGVSFWQLSAAQVEECPWRSGVVLVKAVARVGTAGRCCWLV
jgi:hypothetical protein